MSKTILPRSCRVALITLLSVVASAYRGSTLIQP
jgi:hypothetical protein